MQTVGDVLDSIVSPRPRKIIVETGCIFTRAISLWVRAHPQTDFYSVDLDSILQLATHRELECDGTARYCTFRTQDHQKYLSEKSWVDCVFLNPPDLQSGVTEFSLAVSTGSQIIVMNDFQARSAQAIKKAKELGWEFTPIGTMNVLRRPD